MKTEGTKQDRLNRLRSPMTEGREPNVLIFITINGWYLITADSGLQM